MKVTLSHSDNLHFKATTRQFRNIEIDEPESFHGTDKAPSPIEYFLIGIGGCIGSTFVYCLNINGVKFNNLTICIDGQLKHVGSNMRLRLVKIEVEIHLNLVKNGSETKFNRCKSTFLEFCPISEVITDGIPLDVKIVN